MARRALETEPSAPTSPPRRATRTRTRSTTTKPKEESKVPTTTNTTTTTVKRGRPRKNPETVVEPKAKMNAVPEDPKKRSQRATRAKTSASHLDEDNSSDDEMNIVPTRATAATRSSTRRMATPTSSNSSVASEPKKRATRTTKKKAEPAVDTTELQDVNYDDDDELAETQPVPQKTVQITTTAARRAKAPATTRATKASTRSSALSSATADRSILLSKGRSCVIKKKVTFLDITEHSDKENQPLLDATKSKGKADTGMTAKPVRKGAAAKQKSSDAGEDKKARKKEPLSPKKATQITKTGSSGSSEEDEDDVFGPKSPSKSPQRSPLKSFPVPPSFTSPAKRIDFTQATRPASRDSTASEKEPGTPRGNEQSESMSSPAKRPPPSPFQPAIKESPRKAPIFRSEPQPGQEMVGQHKVSSLKVSPKKGAGMCFIQTSLDAPLSPTKTRTSPLKSPARRPHYPMKMPPPPLTLADRSIEVRESKSHDDIGPNLHGEDCQEEFMDEMADLNISSMDDADENLPHESEEATKSQPYASRHQSSNDDIFMEESHTPNRRETILRHDIMGSLPNVMDQFSTAAPINQQDFIYRDEMIYEDSDAEFEPSPTKGQPRRGNLRSESPEVVLRPQDTLTTELGFTPLADKVSQWAASSPEKQRPRKYRRKGLFSPDVHGDSRKTSERQSHSRIHETQASREPMKPVGEDEVPAIEDLSIHTDRSISPDEESVADSIAEDVDSHMSLGSHRSPSDNISEASEVYGDENAPPTVAINPTLLNEGSRAGLVPHVPAAPPPISMSVTPVRRDPGYLRVIHTVSKVPLKGDGDGSLKVSRKRTRSLGSNTTSPPSALTRSQTLPSPSKDRTLLETFAPTSPGDDSTTNSVLLPERPKSGTWSGRISPVKSRSPAKDENSESEVLKGAVVFVDVHTAEGADASGIFIELLTQMGARCVKSWKWNPRTNLSLVDGAEPQENPKVGITHVIHKDGGVRTLQKVKEANGLVKCVGVGWVLDCERENRWVDEANYAVDISMIPRGGNKRRKSMEPKVLSNQHGTLSVSDSCTSPGSSRRSVADGETLQELRRLSPIPKLHPSRRDSIGPTAFEDDSCEEDSETITTPRRHQSRPTTFEAGEPQTPDGDYGYSFNFDDTAPPSPTTPYYLSEGAKLVQQTCPPKQSRQGLFPANGITEEHQSEKLRIRLEAARRKSLTWKPRIGSPLGRGYM
ncbi:hypothetical protein H112_02896 [Trichophyton rubrum D6]|uniref:BRCT domain-containing protein n=3 Tax=Trichophyton rubrum TaxID=5551 RepID=A0A178EVV0_TRIRU|nr:uncharacterized protein TERG_05523 [Trichophyton rubrum CBS 118892]EZF24592.1 hypothetical protein H100_02900 [Trichophyton rubrum MR850]EZF43625.1 hypothetical protein H102_02893 [Trichophyton rubrum CBS 100081]EZF54248.1 hypothetical protein H103_02907 [Trichophyton rubrum CBS 288.86]EZF64867.1 hypothetical protein H104_02886 [Trichophyton rubrum CBS 289.86]EZF86160.1 hypothetical protein H110_02908 [Trichophyton rubrum MR1448]EZF97093.1 hypothetical protein H113_02905 [Trichophyton rubr